MILLKVSVGPTPNGARLLNGYRDRLIRQTPLSVRGTRFTRFDLVSRSSSTEAGNSVIR